MADEDDKKVLDSRGAPLPRNIYWMFSRYLHNGQLPSKEMLLVSGFYTPSAKSKCSQSKNMNKALLRFVLWGKKMARGRDGGLLLAHSCKKIIPAEDHPDLVMYVHTRAGAEGFRHRGFHNTVKALQLHYAIGHRQFGITDQVVRQTIGRCGDPTCLSRISKDRIASTKAKQAKILECAVTSEIGGSDDEQWKQAFVDLTELSESEPEDPLAEERANKQAKQCDDHKFFHDGNITIKREVSGGNAGEQQTGRFVQLSGTDFLAKSQNKREQTEHCCDTPSVVEASNGGLIVQKDKVGKRNVAKKSTAKRSGANTVHLSCNKITHWISPVTRAVSSESLTELSDIMQSSDAMLTSVQPLDVDAAASSDGEWVRYSKICATDVYSRRETPAEDAIMIISDDDEDAAASGEKKHQGQAFNTAESTTRSKVVIEQEDRAEFRCSDRTLKAGDNHVSHTCVQLFGVSDKPFPTEARDNGTVLSSSYTPVEVSRNESPPAGNLTEIHRIENQTMVQEQRCALAESCTISTTSCKSNRVLSERLSCMSDLDVNPTHVTVQAINISKLLRNVQEIANTTKGVAILPDLRHVDQFTTMYQIKPDGRTEVHYIPAGKEQDAIRQGYQQSNYPTATFIISAQDVTEVTPSQPLFSSASGNTQTLPIQYMTARPPRIAPFEIVPHATESLTTSESVGKMSVDIDAIVSDTSSSAIDLNSQKPDESESTIHESDTLIYESALNIFEEDEKDKDSKCPRSPFHHQYKELLESIENMEKLVRPAMLGRKPLQDALLHGLNHAASLVEGLQGIVDDPDKPPLTEEICL